MNLGTWSILIGDQPFADTTHIVNPEGVDGGPSVMTIEGYGAAAPVYINLGNLKKVQRFTITRYWDSDTDAHAWYQTGVDQFAGAADVELSHLDYEGATANWLIASAKVTLKINAPIGPCTVETLTVEGGQSVLQA